MTFDIGKTLRSLREKGGKTQAQVADAAGLHWNAVARIERGEVQPTFHTVESILAGLGLALRIVSKGRKK